MENNNKKWLRLRMSVNVKHISKEQQQKLLTILDDSPYRKQKKELVELMDIMVNQELTLNLKDFDEYYKTVIEYAEILLSLREWGDFDVCITNTRRQVVLSEDTVCELKDLFGDKLRKICEEFLLGIDSCYQRLNPKQLVKPPTYEEAKLKVEETKHIIEEDEHWREKYLDWPEKYENYFHHSIDKSLYTDEEMIEIYRYYNGVICDNDDKSLKEIIKDCKQLLKYNENNKLKNLRHIAVFWCFIQYNRDFDDSDFNIIYNCFEVLGMTDGKKTDWKNNKRKRHVGMKSIYGQAQLYEIKW